MTTIHRHKVVDIIKDDIKQHSRYKEIAALKGFKGVVVKREQVTSHSYIITITANNRSITEEIDDRLMIKEDKRLNTIDALLTRVYRSLTRTLT